MLFVRSPLDQVDDSAARVARAPGCTPFTEVFLPSRGGDSRYPSLLCVTVSQTGARDHNPRNRQGGAPSAAGTGESVRAYPARSSCSEYLTARRPCAQIEYCLSRRWLQPILASLDLCQCIVQQLAPWDSARGRDLLQLPHFGEEQVKHCASKSNKVSRPGLAVPYSWHHLSVLAPLYRRSSAPSSSSRSLRRNARRSCARSATRRSKTLKPPLP